MLTASDWVPNQQNVSEKITQLFARGICRGAMETGAWMISNGINSGIGRCCGQGIAGLTGTPRCASGAAHLGKIINQDIIKTQEERDARLCAPSILHPAGKGGAHLIIAEVVGRAPIMQLHLRDNRKKLTSRHAGASAPGWITAEGAPCAGS
ncbi:hypothetical protein CYMTET_34697 [Cymbomonas tetramitiformis]|uniref:TRPM SLOG domain-containing protein n=1 Tax=Cymbomonas tetramitiformis TaxID=36881 RepID=A0AAE0FAR6_9CHLO|nr:hypothetical protein CYMTET_34697 [Cymbomonas tetramitiformis]